MGDGYPVDWCEAYRHFSAQCVELARRIDSPRDRSIMLDMALVWRRFSGVRLQDGRSQKTR